MKFHTSLLFIILVGTLAITFILPVTLNAADYVPLAPLPGTVESGCNISDPNANCQADLGTFLPGVFRLLIAIAGGLATLVMVIGGVQYLSTDAISGKEEGMERINNALVGLLLAIASWLILNTINPNTLNFNLSLNRIPAPAGVAPTDPGTVGVHSCTKTTNPTCYNYYPDGSAWPADDVERGLLQAANNVTVTSTGGGTVCTTVGQSGCTSLYGLSSNAIAGLITLGVTCPGCVIEVTAGTEFWAHNTHGPGYGRVDLNYGNTSDTIYRFLQTSGASASSSSCIPNSNFPAWSYSGGIYVLEKDNTGNEHWHVCY